MNPLAAYICENKGHIPVNHDPTGGDPFMGGPVMLTICDRCGKELEKSTEARLFNQYHSLLRVRQDEHDADLAAAEQHIRDVTADVLLWRMWTFILLVVVAILLVGLVWVATNG